MKTLEELKNELNALNRKLTDILSLSKYDEYGDLYALEINHQDSEQLFLLHELGAVMEHLNIAQKEISYLNQPVVALDVLHKNNNNRYSCSLHEFTCGNEIECLIQDPLEGCLVWVHTRVEHNGEDYCLVGYKNIKLEGLTVRFRKNS